MNKTETSNHNEASESMVTMRYLSNDGDVIYEIKEPTEIKEAYKKMFRFLGVEITEAMSYQEIFQHLKTGEIRVSSAIYS